MDPAGVRFYVHPPKSAHMYSPFNDLHVSAMWKKLLMVIITSDASEGHWVCILLAVGGQANRTLRRYCGGGCGRQKCASGVHSVPYRKEPPVKYVLVDVTPYNFG